MDFLDPIIWLILTVCVITLLTFSLYPLIALLLSFVSRVSALNIEDDYSPSVTIFIVVRNAEDLIQLKIQNSLALDFPKEKLQVVVVSDGSIDETVPIAQKMANEQVHLFTQPAHCGKSAVINSFIKECSGEIVIFSDVDAIVNSDAVLKLVDHLKNPGIGGVCGQRVIKSDFTKITKPQKGYIKVDSLIKKLENNSGSITSNDGKLFAIRKALFCPIEDGVTDDMFLLLSVVKQGYRFIFEPDAIAFIRTPSRSFKHEIERRRRITTGSIRGILFNKVLLNPLKYGFFSLKLLINKVLRRLMPVCLIGVFFTSFKLSFSHNVLLPLFLCQVVLYVLAVIYPILFQSIKKGNRFTKTSALLWYFCLGNYGQFLGLVDCVFKRTVTKWDPRKDDTKII